MCFSLYEDILYAFVLAMGIADFFTTKFKTTIFRNLLQSHLGEFFVGDLSADQLALDFTNGTAEIQNIPLNVEVIFLNNLH